jgi:hypothetical protein
MTSVVGTVSLITQLLMSSKLEMLDQIVDGIANFVVWKYE